MAAARTEDAAAASDTYLLIMKIQISVATSSRISELNEADDHADRAERDEEIKESAYAENQIRVILESAKCEDEKLQVVNDEAHGMTSRTS
ncbi:MAG: hypothetical protein WKF84_15525 [Pyrinomonadaceae bacterium]